MQLPDWLNEKNIKVPPKALRAELWVLAKQEREKFPSKIIEAIAEQGRHVVLRLPPYHCELNPIELAWAAENNYVAAENKEMTLCSVDKLLIKKNEASCARGILEKLRGAREKGRRKLY